MSGRYVQRQDRYIGSSLTGYKPSEQPTSSIPKPTSDTIQSPNWAEIPDLTAIPTDTTNGAFWTECGQYRGTSLSTTPPPNIPFIITGSNSNQTGNVKGYNITDLTGTGNISTNDVVRFDFNSYITRALKCDSSGTYNYYLNFVPFSQPGNTQSSLLYDTVTPEHAVSWIFKNKPNMNYRLVLSSLAIKDGQPIAISDSNLIKPLSTYDQCNCGVRFRILSQSLITANVGKQIGLPSYVQYEALINIRSSQQAGYNKKYPAPSQFYGQSSYGKTQNNPYPYEHMQDDPTITICGDVVGKKIVFILAPNTSENANKTTATGSEYAASIEFVYTTKISGQNLVIDCAYFATGNEAIGFVDELVKGKEETNCNVPAWIVSPNFIYPAGQNNLPAFSTPAALSPNAYKPELNGTCQDTRSVSLLITIPVQN